MRGKKPLHAVNGVLWRCEGEVLALVGKSGCGKTTLARMLLGLLAPILRLDQYCRAADRGAGAAAGGQLVQPVFQDPYSSLNPRKSIGSIIALPLKVQGGLDPTAAGAAASRR